MFWSAVCFLIKLEYCCSCLTPSSELEESRGNLKIQDVSQAHQRKDYTKSQQDFFACCIVWQESAGLRCVHSLSENVLNQQNFDFESEEWGHFQRGSDKSSVLACSLSFFFLLVLFFLEFSINKTQTANIVGYNKNNTVHLRMCWWCSRVSKSEERQFILISRLKFML